VHVERDQVTEWAVGLTGGKANDLDRIGALAPPGANGVVLVPYLDGERTPLLPTAPEVSRGFARRQRSPTSCARPSKRHLGLLAGVDALERCDVDTNGRILAVGGGARSTLYRQVLADLSTREIVTPDPAVDRVAVGRGGSSRRRTERATPDSVGAAWARSERVVVVTEPRSTLHSRQRFVRVIARRHTAFSLTSRIESTQSEQR